MAGHNYQGYSGRGEASFGPGSSGSSNRGESFISLAGYDRPPDDCKRDLHGRERQRWFGRNRNGRPRPRHGGPSRFPPPEDKDSSICISDYFHPSMLEDPWQELEYLVQLHKSLQSQLPLESNIMQPTT